MCPQIIPFTYSLSCLVILHLGQTYRILFVVGIVPLCKHSFKRQYTKVVYCSRVLSSLFSACWKGEIKPGPDHGFLFICLVFPGHFSTPELLEKKEIYLKTAINGIILILLRKLHITMAHSMDF